jgi:TolB-like protein
LQKGLSVMLTTDLAKVKDLEVVERAKLQAVLEEIELGTSGLVDTATAPRVGRLVGARFLSGGDILKGAVTQLQVAPNLLDASEQNIINQASAEGNLNDLIAIEKEILFDIIDQMEIILTPDEKAELEKPISTSIPALMLLFRGIDASDHGNYAKAADLYEQALTQDANLTPAKEALNEINALDLASQTAETPSGQESAPEAVSAPKKGGGLLKWAAVGLGVAAAGAGGYFLATSGDDDDEEEDPPPVQPMVISTNPSNGEPRVSDSLQEIIVVFNKAMDTNAGQVVTQASDWQVPGAARIEWQAGGQTMVIRRLDDNTLPSGGVVVTLQGFQDTEGLAMDTFSFSLRYFLKLWRSYHPLPSHHRDH